jgi:hypothetical protein
MHRVVRDNEQPHIQPGLKRDEHGHEKWGIATEAEDEYSGDMRCEPRRDDEGRERDPDQSMPSD